ncbi:hypothetical protein FC093_00010 [Ilyomonas limi]|uniref:Helix-turn-helix domain-containing protein n=1 Tax=Ilyomonas limi TaxID=2575867 RepID=A0A4U3L8Q2_9BACT|nr:hypothetical protein [Ilyomonas limi]TKK71450.1 hypothetical protein FC093_00010 [Ilyomonas limi]
MNCISSERNEVLTPIDSFYESVKKDAIISATHISLYFALYYQWQLNHCISPFEIKRDNIMKLAKISSRKTFNKCMHVLHETGYIRYIPSYNPEISSMICLIMTDI